MMEANTKVGGVRICFLLRQHVWECRVAAGMCSFCLRLLVRQISLTLSSSLSLPCAGMCALALEQTSQGYARLALTCLQPMTRR
jgi:hypothetical protein